MSFQVFNYRFLFVGIFQTQYILFEAFLKNIKCNIFLVRFCCKTIVVIAETKTAKLITLFIFYEHWQRHYRMKTLHMTNKYGTHLQMGDE